MLSHEWVRGLADELSEHIWNDEDKRDFVLAVSATVSGRKAVLNQSASTKRHDPGAGLTIRGREGWAAVSEGL